MLCILAFITCILNLAHIFLTVSFKRDNKMCGHEWNVLDVQYDEILKHVFTQFQPTSKRMTSIEYINTSIVLRMYI